MGNSVVELQVEEEVSAKKVFGILNSDIQGSVGVKSGYRSDCVKIPTWYLCLLLEVPGHFRFSY